MAKTETRHPDEAIYRAFGDDKESTQTEAQLQKASGLDDEAWADKLAEMKARLWVDVDESGKTPKFALTETGRRTLSGYYDTP